LWLAQTLILLFRAMFRIVYIAFEGKQNVDNQSFQDRKKDARLYRENSAYAPMARDIY
jgi:hypothetical protein